MRSTGSGWSRGATSWCAGSSTTFIPTSSRPTTAAWCSRSPTRRTTPCWGRPISSSRARPVGSRSRPRRSTTSVPPPMPISRPPVAPGDVVWSYAGIRPLFDDQAKYASEVTRDYVLHLDPAPAPMLSVYGGKITTYRRLAERAVDMLAGPLRVSGSRWTGAAPLPGGDIPNADIDAFTAQCAARYSWMPERLLRHFIRHYGTDIHAPARRPQQRRRPRRALRGRALRGGGRVSGRARVGPDRRGHPVAAHPEGSRRLRRRCGSDCART